jgi:uncharacterized membrane protein YoaK (UPF0700 family)
MISKLPRWVWAGAWVLAFIAGMVNVVGFLSFKHQAVTHLTGTTSMLAAAVAQLDYADMRHFAAAIGSFLAGTVISGFIIQDSTLQLGHRYGVALLLESVLLCGAVPLITHGSDFGFYSAACACGLQNAMMSTFSGAVVRTTHISGMFTDLGIFLGRPARAPVLSDHHRLFQRRRGECAGFFTDQLRHVVPCRWFDGGGVAGIWGEFSAARKGGGEGRS